MTQSASREETAASLPAPVAKGFSRRAVEELSWLREEPGWLRQRRLEAWRIYEATPMPSRTDELWRRTDISGIPLDDLALPGQPTTPLSAPDQLPADVCALALPRKGGVEQAGLLALADSLSYRRLDEELARKGVILTSLEQAVREHPELVQEHLMTRCISFNDGKFAALHDALWSGGVFLYVPRDVSVELPLYAVTYVSEGGLALFPHTLVVLERGSSATLVDEHTSPTREAASFSDPAVEILLQEGAHLRYIAVQGWGNHTSTIGIQRAHLGRDSYLETLNVSFGGRISKTQVETRLAEPGARSDMLGITFGDGSQHFDRATAQEHLAPHTQSDLLYKAALKDRARSIYYGAIHMRKAAQQSQAFQTDRNLLLGGRARADSIPVLEIEADDVRCSHAAAVGPVDREQLFYLMTRGLEPGEAQRVLVEAFFEPIMERVPVEWVRERLRAAIQKKIG